MLISHQEVLDSSVPRTPGSCKIIKPHISHTYEWSFGQLKTVAMLTLVQSSPWGAYRQFYQHFLAPLSLMAFTNIALSKLMISHLGGIPEPLRIIQDFGANTGEFSCIAAKYCELVVSQDIDPVAVELNFRENAAKGPDNILPLIRDFSSPSPAIGWGNTERSSFLERSGCDALLVLALIHHLAISNNVPLPNIAVVPESSRVIYLMKAQQVTPH